MNDHRGAAYAMRDMSHNPNYNVNFKVSYVDFPPRCAGAGEVICAPVYERFE